ncbi:MAG: hypothetical protein PVSMB11_00850 [Desulfuromonadaceae bacterium]
MARLTKTGCVPGSWGRGIAAIFCLTASLQVCLMILTVCLTILLSGCAQLPIAGPDAARLTSTVVARLDAEPLFAAAPDGKQVAFSHEGVRVAHLPSGESHTLTTERPLALVWSPDGGRLAVAFGRGTESWITVFGTNGVPVAETAAAGRVGALFWPASDSLLAVTMELEPHKFGTSCREVLLRWQLGGTPDRTVLHEVTLKPYTLRKWGAELLSRAISPAISPLGDELAYGRIQDPPAFDAYLKVMVRNLSSGTEREIARTGFNDGSARFSADGEELLMDYGSGQILRIAIWSGTEKRVAPFSGRSLAVSPDGRHLLADGRLLDDGREVALFPTRTTGEFLDDGRLLVVADGTLFLVSGFEASVAGPAMPPEKLERLRTIRAWRASGLISADDYVTAREKVMK